ncbi:MAG: DUF502 domain-containing protein [Candidatus Zixiibacteriota bacterium]
MSTAGKIAAAVKRFFLSGVLVVVPLILTYLVLRFLFDTIDGILQPLVERALGYYIPGLGIFTTLLIIILAGVLTRNIIGARIYTIGERMLVRMPIIRPVYSAAKQLLEAVTLPSTTSFKEVVLIEYPRRGVYVLGFVSSRLDLVINGEVRKFATVFVPSTPTPVSGFAVMAPVDEVIPVNMTVEEGIKFLVSGGVASPPQIAGQTA